MTDTSCANHPDALGAPCAGCGRSICTNCTIGFENGFVCAACAGGAQRGRSRRRIAIGAGALVLVGAGIVAVAAVTPAAEPADPADPPPAAPVEASDAHVDKLHAQLRADPCSAKTIMELTDYLSKQQRYRDVLDDANHFLGRCGDVDRLRWNMENAHKRLGAFVAEAIDDTAIIATGPGDYDYWRWRAEAWARAQHPELALADLRQAIANTTSYAPDLATLELEQAATDVKRPCEGARAARHQVRFYNGQPLRDVGDISMLAATGRCAAEDGRGHLRLAIDPTMSLGDVRVVIGGAEGRFLVDPSAGTTVVSAAFAAKAALAPTTAERGQSLVAGRTRIGALVVVPELRIKSASARAVEALVVDDLPPEVDGVLGLSFFWHFDLSFDGNAAILSEPTR